MARNVVVTGGGTGIGYEVARRFAEAGEQVVIVGRRRAVLEQAAADLGPNVTPWSATSPTRTTSRPRSPNCPSGSTCW